MAITECIDYNWYHRHFIIHSFFSSLIGSRYISLFFLFFQFYSVVSRHSKVHNFTSCLSFFFNWLSLDLVVWQRLDDPFVYQNPWEVCASRSLGRILGCAYTPFSNGQFKIFCTVPGGLSSPPSCGCYCNFFALIYCIHLLWNWSFHFYHHIVDICHFVESYLILSW